MNRIHILIICIATIFLKPADILAQQKRADDMKPNKIFNFQFHYTYHEPSADLSKRFGTMHGAGFGFLFKTKGNFIYSLDGAYLFGDVIKENNFLLNLTNSNGVITNTGGYPADYSLTMRGIQLYAKFGKVFPLSVLNRNSGIMLMAGPGFFSHHINITTNNNDIAPLTDEFKKGYDRLSMGPALSETVGYYFHSKNRFINFYAAFDMTQAFTQSVRKYNYDLMSADTKQRLDMMWGIRFAWMIPMYLTTKEEDEFHYK